MYKRVPIQIRMNPEGLAKLDAIAAEHTVTRTDVIRACLAVAFTQPVAVAAHIKKMKETL